jgi:hypothetical protein
VTSGSNYFWQSDRALNRVRVRPRECTEIHRNRGDTLETAIRRETAGCRRLSDSPAGRTGEVSSSCASAYQIDAMR